jgi:hypothetical protein
MPHQPPDRFASGRGGSRTTPSLIGIPAGVGDHHNTVQVVGHDNPGVRHHVIVLRGQPLPHLGNDASGIVQAYRAIDNIAEYTHPTLRDDSNEIGPRLAVIVSLQADTAAMVLFGIVPSSPRSSQNCSATRYSKPKYAFCTIALLRRLVAVSSSTISPLCNTYPRWAIERACKAFCSTNRTVVPC